MTAARKVGILVEYNFEEPEVRGIHGRRLAFDFELL